MKTLKLALVQYDIVWENPELNFQILEEKLKDVKADIYFLPEMFSTGFTMNPEKLAEPAFGISFQFKQRMAIDKNAVFVGSVPTRVGSHFYNRLYWVEPNETFVTYDKRHLFSLVGEENHYSAGIDRKIISYQGWKLMPQVCYDLRFPVWSRNNLDYDMLFYVANWPEKRSFAWTQLLIARAIENQSYVIGVNRIGVDANGINYTGDSMVYDPLGQEVPSERFNDILIFQIDQINLKIIRDKFKFLQDQDDYKI